MVTVSRKQHFPLSSHSLGHYTPFSVGSDLWQRLRKGRAVGAAVLVLPSSQSCFLSHPLSDPIWMAGLPSSPEGIPLTQLLPPVSQAVFLQKS